MGEPNIAWVPGQGSGPSRASSRVARILRHVGDAAAAAARSEGTAVRLHLGSAARLLADEGLDTLEHMQRTGELPYAGTPEWRVLVADAERGDVELAIIVIRRPAHRSMLAEMRADGTV
jgi:hypothetical protein